MNTLSPNLQLQRPVLTNTFMVNDSHLNHKDVLSTCKILETITTLKDEAIVQILGVLDFDKMVLVHFYIDFIAQAVLNDVITFQSYTNNTMEDLIEISVIANKKQGKWNVPIVNSNFVFAVNKALGIT